MRCTPALTLLNCFAYGSTIIQALPIILVRMLHAQRSCSLPIYRQASEAASLIQRDFDPSDIMKAHSPFGLEGGEEHVGRCGPTGCFPAYDNSDRPAAYHELSSPRKYKTKSPLLAAHVRSPTATANRPPVNSPKPVGEEVVARQGYYPTYDNGPYPTPVPTDFLQAVVDQLTRG